MNRIGEIIKERGFEDLIPNQSILDEMCIKLHTWNKWVRNTKDPEMWQLPIISRFLDCEIEDLFPKPQDKGIISKHGLIQA